jgi:hypothetical protein
MFGLGGISVHVPTALIAGVHVPTALISGVFTVIVAFITYFTTLRSAKKRAPVDEKLANLKGEIDRSIEERRAAINERLTQLKSRLDEELAYQKARLDYRTEFAAEDTARVLLDHEKLTTRTFVFLRHRLRGFQDDELRRILVRCGAVHILGKDSEERWGLQERNPEFHERTPHERGKDLLAPHG